MFITLSYRHYPSNSYQVTRRAPKAGRIDEQLPREACPGCNWLKRLHCCCTPHVYSNSVIDSNCTRNVVQHASQLPDVLMTFVAVVFCQAKLGLTSKHQFSDSVFTPNPKISHLTQPSNITAFKCASFSLSLESLESFASSHVSVWCSASRSI